MVNPLRRFFADERGATIIEYALMVALIAVISLAAVGALGDGIFDAFNQTNDQIHDPGGPVPPTTPQD